MKRLSDMTLGDAISILSVEYPFFLTGGKWELTDESVDMKEPAKKLKNKNKVFIFWFFDNKMDIDKIPEDDDNITFTDMHIDVKYKCYIKAHQMGYYVPELSELLTKMPDPDELLADAHDKYIKEVTESGVPRWILDQIHNYTPNPNIKSEKVQDSSVEAN